MRVLITGGAGYIGSHTAMHLHETGLEPVVYDNLSSGHGWAVQWGPFIKGDLSDARLLKSVLLNQGIQAVIHFAALATAGESMGAPGPYFQNNLGNSLTLLECMREADVRTIVFSSSAAVYGVPQVNPVAETHVLEPVNPYGESKSMVERVLRWYEHVHGFRWAALRYFNAAGADPNGLLGESHRPETHLIPLALQAAIKRQPELEVYGTDYQTPDGTAVRDYVHVTDLATAHRAALDYLTAGGASLTCNLGTGKGYSVYQVVKMVEQITRLTVPVLVAPRRAQDPATLIADPTLAQQILGWKPRCSDLDTIVQTAFRWQYLCSGRYPESPLQ